MKNLVAQVNIILGIVAFLAGTVITIFHTPWGLVGIIFALWMSINVFAMFTEDK